MYALRNLLVREGYVHEHGPLGNLRRKIDNDLESIVAERYGGITSSEEDTRVMKNDGS